MTKQFDEKKYRQDLIDRGADPDVATDVAHKTAESHREQQEKERKEQEAMAMARATAITDSSQGLALVKHVVSHIEPPADVARRLAKKERPPKRPPKSPAGKKAASTVRKGKSLPPPAEQAFDNRQLTLFQSFLANDDAQRNILSNAVDLWDSIPGYSMSRRRMDELREPNGYLPIRKVPFRYRSIDMTAVIRPARLEIKDDKGHPTGKTIEYYPSAREELIEQALRHMASEKGAGGFFEDAQHRSGLYFTLYRLRQELAKHGHSMTHRDLAEGLDVLSLGSIDIEIEGQDSLGVGKFGRATFIVNLAGVKKEDLDRDPHARWYVEFHPFVTASIEAVSYRQFNYDRWMKGRSQLARWLIKQLVLKYTQASVGNSFTMKYSTIKRDSGMLDGYKLERQAVAALDATWTELQQLGVLMTCRKEEERGARAKLVDVAYVLHPSRAFVSEQRAANKRSLDARAELNPPQQDKLL
ncbi:replication protein [bacterium]|nr:MAG: replication protein [bacterium]